MAKTVKDIKEFVNQITIFDAIHQCKNVWDAVSGETKLLSASILMPVLHVPLMPLKTVKVTKTKNLTNISRIYLASHGRITY